MPNFMNSLPEVNTPLTREVHYGEIVDLDPVKWTLESYTTAANDRAHRKKYPTLAFAWWLSQPGREKQGMFREGNLADNEVYQIRFRVPLEKLGGHGAPGVSYPFFLDAKAFRQGKAESPTINHDIAPMTMLIDPNEFRQSDMAVLGCSLREIAYLLCLSGTSLLKSAHINWDDWDKYDVIQSPTDMGFEYFIVSVSFSRSVLHDREQWFRELSPKELYEIIEEITDTDKWDIQYLWAEPGSAEAIHYEDQMYCRLADASASNSITKMKLVLRSLMDSGGGDKWRLVHTTGDIGQCDIMYTRIREAFTK